MFEVGRETGVLAIQPKNYVLVVSCESQKAPTHVIPTEAEESQAVYFERNATSLFGFHTFHFTILFGRARFKALCQNITVSYRCRCSNTKRVRWSKDSISPATVERGSFLGVFLRGMTTMSYPGAREASRRRSASRTSRFIRFRSTARGEIFLLTTTANRLLSSELGSVANEKRLP